VLGESSCTQSPPPSPVGGAEPGDLLRQMAEAHSEVAESPEGAGEAYPAEPVARSDADFALFDGELRCVRMHFGEQSSKRSLAEDGLRLLWDMTPEWAARQRRRLGLEPARAARHEAVARHRFEQVCRRGQATAPFLAQLKD
jgi:hypothetical protein